MVRALKDYENGEGKSVALSDVEHKGGEESEKNQERCRRRESVDWLNK